MGDDALCPRIYTIGHSIHTHEAFIGLLKDADIDVLVDVRSRPYSRYTPHFNGESLKEAAPAAGVKYLFLGKELGGRPDGARFYDADGHVLYGEVARSPLFLGGLERLEAGLRRYRVAMMCAEEDPASCHRRLLVGRVLAARGVDVVHIRGSGAMQTEQELRHDETGGQRSLFDDQEVREWKSIRSVLPREARPASLEP